MKMNNHQIEQKYQAKKAEMLQKYDANIRNFSKYHNVDMSVAWDMLRFNAECMYNGVMKEIIPGGGSVDMAELVKDYAVLEECSRAFDHAAFNAK